MLVLLSFNAQSSIHTRLLVYVQVINSSYIGFTVKFKKPCCVGAVSSVFLFLSKPLKPMCKLYLASVHGQNEHVYYLFTPSTQKI